MNLPLRILYVCTHNRCRSILSEAVTNQLADGRILARSAGSQPAGQVHPLSLKYLDEAGVATDGLGSQSWDDFEAFDPHLVITVCDSAANEPCPLWIGPETQVHWGLVDPSAMDGDDALVADAFRGTISEIRRRVNAILELDLDGLAVADLAAAIRTLAGQS